MSEPFTAVLLAGGKSTRMGRDKATLLIEGVSLWQHQLAKLRALAPSEVFISGPLDGPWRGAGIEAVEDLLPGQGPLAGLHAALRRMSHDWLLVLAIDLPDVPSSFLADVVASTYRARIGQVPVCGDWFQPLAAVYPLACLPLVEECLAAGQRALRPFTQRAQELHLLAPYRIFPEVLALFRNLNTSADLIYPRRSP